MTEKKKLADRRPSRARIRSSRSSEPLRSPTHSKPSATRSECVAASVLVLTPEMDEANQELHEVALPWWFAEPKDYSPELGVDQKGVSHA